jgi:pyruvate/2-oxoglutarate/acetoin dehydrogenase E1 component
LKENAAMAGTLDHGTRWKVSVVPLGVSAKLSIGFRFLVPPGFDLAIVPIKLGVDRQSRCAPSGSGHFLITYGGSLWKTIEAAGELAAEGIEAEVIDLRSLRPLDDASIITSVAKTRRAVIVDEGWRSGNLAAEIAMRIVEQAFWSLDVPIGRVYSEEVPIP